MNTTDGIILFVEKQNRYHDNIMSAVSLATITVKSDTATALVWFLATFNQFYRPMRTLGSL